MDDTYFPGGFLSTPDVKRIEITPPQQVVMVEPIGDGERYTARLEEMDSAKWWSSDPLSGPTYTRIRYIRHKHVYRQWCLASSQYTPGENIITEMGSYVDFVSYVWVKAGDCLRCVGSGIVHQQGADPVHTMLEPVKCSRCNGTGNIQ